MPKSIIIALFYSLFMSLVTVSAETYDSQVYYFQYNEIKSWGLIDFGLVQKIDSGKFEPGLYFIYSLFPSELGIYAFSIFNYLIISFWLIVLFALADKYLVVEKKFKFSGFDKLGIFFIFAIFFIWYPNYMNVLWVWRSFISIIILASSLFLIEFNRIFLAIIFIILSILVHQIALAFIALYLIFLVLTRYHKRQTLFYQVFKMFCIGVLFGFLILKLKNQFEFMFSGGGWSAELNLASMVSYLYIVSTYTVLCVFIRRQKSIFIKKIIGYSYFIAGIGSVFIFDHLILMRFIFPISVGFGLVLYLCRFCLSRSQIRLMAIVMLPGFFAAFKSITSYLMPI